MTVFSGADEMETLFFISVRGPEKAVYMFIGDMIYTYNAILPILGDSSWTGGRPKTNKIIECISDVGNNRVASPIARGEEGFVS